MIHVFPLYSSTLYYLIHYIEVNIISILLLLLLLTAIGLSHGGSSPTLVQTKIKIHKTTKHKKHKTK
jgi:hypothetical protein